MAGALVLVLISRGGDSSDSGPVRLKGSTTRGEPVSLKVVDGRVESFTARIGVSCSFQKLWHGWDWSAHGPFGGEGADFEYGDRNRFPDGGRFLSVMRGRLTEDGRVRPRNDRDHRHLAGHRRRQNPLSEFARLRGREA